MIIPEFTLSPEDEAFRDEVRAFLAEAFTPDLRAEAAIQAGVFAHAGLGLEWQRRLYRRGWGAPTWPKEWGGADFTPVQRYLFSVECAAAGTPTVGAMGLQMCGPVLMAYGTEAQKARFLPHIPSAEHYWCQGFSEPGAGSDLSSLRCAAVLDGDDYVVTGSKIWTTHAQFANWIFMLVRTGTEGARQAGITFLLSPIDAPGVTVRPIRSISGEHEVNEVFFDGVRVPVANRVGEDGQGWEIAKFLLVNERGGGSAAAALKSALARTRAVIAREFDEAGAPLADDPHLRRRLAMMEIEIAAIEATERSNLTQPTGSGRYSRSVAASIQKLKVSAMIQRLAELSVEAIGPHAMIDYRAQLYGEEGDDGVLAGSLDPRATVVARHMNMRATTIYGGASEIQRGIVARHALGF